MYLDLEKDGGLSLREADDFGGFHIRDATGRLDRDQAGANFQAIAQFAGDGHFWLEADAVAELSGRTDDAAWLRSFWAMLEKVRPYGYYDPHSRRLKAHVD